LYANIVKIVKIELDNNKIIIYFWYDYLYYTIKSINRANSFNTYKIKFKSIYGKMCLKQFFICWIVKLVIKWFNYFNINLKNINYEMILIKLILS
jgi:hypothetical protein